MNTLIAILENLTGPDRQADADIATSLGNKVYQVTRRDGQGSWTRYEFRDGNEVPAYTESIDAALTLVPRNAEWECGSAKLLGTYWAEVITPAQKIIGKGVRSPALALCIAALKARAAVTAGK